MPNDCFIVHVMLVETLTRMLNSCIRWKARVNSLNSTSWSLCKWSMLELGEWRNAFNWCIKYVHWYESHLYMWHPIPVILKPSPHCAGYYLQISESELGVFLVPFYYENVPVIKMKICALLQFYTVSSNGFVSLHYL